MIRHGVIKTNKFIHHTGNAKLGGFWLTAQLEYIRPKFMRIHMQANNFSKGEKWWSEELMQDSCSKKDELDYWVRKFWTCFPNKRN